MTRNRLFAILSIALCAVVTSAPLHAATPDRDWPSVVVTPAIDVPMRDTAITRGPDGVYYLTGTLGVKKKSGVRSQESEGSDFENSRQIKLWKSNDLKKWDDLGAVWDQDIDVFGPKGDLTHEKTGWMRQSHKDPAAADTPVVHGLKSPELHHIKSNWYICFSINDQGTGLLKSSSGKPEGPYEAWAQITLRHGDPTMFWDTQDAFGGDDSVYWLFGGGWIAKMNDDLTAIVEQPRLLTTQHENPPHFAVAKGAKIYRDHPLTVGDHGVFLFKNRGRYYLSAAERTNRLNAGCDDTFVAWSDALMGPYSESYLMIPHGGGVTVFRGPRSSAVPDYYYPQQAYYLQSIAASAKPVGEIEKAKGDAPLYASFSGNDERVIFRDRPAFVPLEWTNRERQNDTLFGVRESTPVKPKCVITMRGPWRWMKPLLPADEVVRDITVSPAPDGQYYFSGAAISHPGKLMIWKSADLARWQAVDPPVWSYENIEWLEKKLPYLDEPGKTDWNHIFWHSFITWHNNTFYITFNIFGNDTPGLRGAGALKSTTGKIEGPYQSLGRVGGHVGKDPGPNLFFFSRWQGKLYAWDWINYKNVVACADLDVPGWKWDWKRVDGGNYEHMHRGDCSMVHIWDDVPVFIFHSSGKLDLKERALHTYDVNYVPMETPWGPPRGKPRTIPHVASGNVFQDHKGYWWASYFGSDHSGPWDCRFGLVALHVEKRGTNDLFIDVEDHPDDYQKRVMGAGLIAEVKTVLETLP